jgi:hypothetical protein
MNNDGKIDSWKYNIFCGVDAWGPGWPLKFPSPVDSLV